MAVYKDKWNGYKGDTWRVAVYYRDWKGVRKKHEKRGFATKKDALAYEREYIAKTSKDINMGFNTFVDIYMDDIKPQIKLSTYEIKNNIINTHIRPYFENMSLSDINATDVLKWQNEMLVSICGRKYLFRLMIGMNIQRQNYGEGHGQNIVTDTLMRKIRLIIEVMNVKV